MSQSIVHVALAVRDYDEAIQFFTEKLNFTKVESSGTVAVFDDLYGNRWDLLEFSRTHNEPANNRLSPGR